MTRKTPRIALASAVVLAAAALTASGMSASASASPASAPSKALAAPAHKNHGKGKDQTVTIYLTRHGQTILNTLERVQGWIDSPLVVGTNADGSVLDARTLPVTVGKNLRAREGKIDATYSADMKRHYETATFMLKGAKQNLSVKQDSRLREINFGKYEGAENKEMWTEIVEHMGYTVNHDAPATAPVDATGQNGGWQTMQLLAINERGLKGDDGGHEGDRRGAHRDRRQAAGRGLHRREQAHDGIAEQHRQDGREEPRQAGAGALQRPVDHLRHRLAGHHGEHRDLQRRDQQARVQQGSLDGEVGGRHQLPPVITIE